MYLTKEKEAAAGLNTTITITTPPNNVNHSATWD